MIWLVRHGESAGNVARDHAEAAGHPLIDIAERDMDVPLSALGRRQSEALGKWFAAMPPGGRPTVILTSPYLRAMQTAASVAERLTKESGAEAAPVLTLDERLREKEFGALDRLTKAGIVARFPDQAELRARLGKFYYRPPAGESWCDVILRLRSVLDHVQLQHRCERVLIVAHQVIVLCFRYLLEHMTERQVLEIDAAGDVVNCGVTWYRFERDEQGRGSLRLGAYNQTTPLEEAGQTITAQPDAPVAPR